MFKPIPNFTLTNLELELMDSHYQWSIHSIMIKTAKEKLLKYVLMSLVKKQQGRNLSYIAFQIMVLSCTNMCLNYWRKILTGQFFQKNHNIIQHGCTNPLIFGASPFALAYFEALSTIGTHGFWSPKISSIEETLPADPNS